MKSISEQIAKRQIDSLPLIQNYTCILIRNSSNYKVHGTGVFIKIGHLHLLISAAHVFDDFNELFIPLDNGENLMKPGGRIIVNNPKSSRDNDELDIGIVILDEVTINEIIRTYNFLDENSLLINHRNNYSYNYIIWGYPSSWSKRSISKKSFHSRPFIHFTKCANPIEYQRLNRYKFLNLIVNYDRQNILNFKSKKFSYGPDLFGISGCGLWYINPEDYNENANPKLVGIMTDWPISNRRKLIATRIDAVTEFLRKNENINFPESYLFSIK
ncbi:hypothetical protein QE422_001916 [Chryseobacterium sp. SORGH_AS 447]|uniref:hypothetical protein n=1 Tax=Chryseobacterium sp. SORGH_AS_0447 TaxID=3041769 RepID=UPI0027833D41|nr:hypothetical protein [Chryseobacterium sp. SORGH_AS_0447]MDQ1161548.1 hypothetical protein [Chryseobacterium sp. SORGH_AS_0447]